MKGSFSLLSAFLAAITTTNAAIIPTSDVAKRQSCTNGPTSRRCWSDGFDIDTDVYQTWPDTGNVVPVTLTITNTTCNQGGGGTKYCQLINGQYPGPVIRAKWGDTLKITVNNELDYNGTSIHWHGLRQYHTNEQDGSNGATECPIAPHTSKTYTFKATQYGTTWYHSHHTAQYGEGVVGSIVIDGPTTADYDEDLGVLPLTDWYYDQIYFLLWRALYGTGAPPRANTTLVNGTMIDGKGNGEYQRLNVERGKKYKLRFVNTAVDHLFHVSMDNHPFTVVAADFVPVTPYQTTDLKINIGQRYDVIFTADQLASNYWLRVQPGAAACGRATIYDNANVTVGAILSYSGSNSSTTLPTSTGYPLAANCDDEVTTPYKALSVPEADFAAGLGELDITLGRSTDGRNIVNWFINGSSMDVDWEKPTLEYVRTNDTNYLRSMNVVEMPVKDKWYFWIIQNTNAPGLPHPIHLHGHDFWHLGSGAGTFPGTTSGLNFANAERRDVQTLPGGGWMVLAFPADNPGAWLMHCHIAWHASQGLAMQFLERREEIVNTIGPLQPMVEECDRWSAYWDSPLRPYQDEDSGLFAPGPPASLHGPGGGSGV